LLRDVTGLLQARVRTADTLARLGGMSLASCLRTARSTSETHR